MSNVETNAPRPRWERRKEARPAELLAAALDLFVEKGYAGTRLDDVAARAGVSKGTLYLYFENKEDLFKAVVRENIVTRISEAAQEVGQADGPTDALLRGLINDWWQDFGCTQAGGLTKLLMAESGNFPEIARFYLDEVIEPWHRLLGSVIERGVRRGEFRSVDVAVYARVMTAPLVMLCLWNRSFGPCSAKPVDAGAFLQTVLDTHILALQFRGAPGRAKPRAKATTGPAAKPAATRKAHK